MTKVNRKVSVRIDLVIELRPGAIRLSSNERQVALFIENWEAMESLLAIDWPTSNPIKLVKKASEFISQDILLQLADSEVVLLRQGKLKIKSWSASLKLIRCYLKIHYGWPW